MISRRIAELFEGYNWLIIPAAFLTIVLHEVAHGYAAYLLGDRTAKNSGRLTLNPAKHFDIIGLIAMVLFGFGWAKPVPVNPYYFKNRKRDMAITALAGPAANVIMALIGLIPLTMLDGIELAGGSMYYYFYCSETTMMLATFLWYFVMLNVSLAVFNLIPIPPLDGSKILNTFLSERTYFTIMQYERYGFLVLLVLINIPAFERIVFRLQSELLNFLYLIVGV